jgi:hypothetical protein
MNGLIRNVLIGSAVIVPLLFFAPASTEASHCGSYYGPRVYHGPTVRHYRYGAPNVHRYDGCSPHRYHYYPRGRSHFYRGPYLHHRNYYRGGGSLHLGPFHLRLY